MGYEPAPIRSVFISRAKTKKYLSLGLMGCESPLPHLKKTLPLEDGLLPSPRRKEVGLVPWAPAAAVSGSVFPKHPAFT